MGNPMASILRLKLRKSDNPRKPGFTSFIIERQNTRLLKNKNRQI
jgi:hypothetical protein